MKFYYGNKIQKKYLINFNSLKQITYYDYLSYGLLNFLIYESNEDLLYSEKQGMV